jgi:3-phosphoshikimate 1-carboxyvinyltransferase
MKISIYPTKQLLGTPPIPGDKSISHRALLLGALAEGTTEISNLLESEDIYSTLNCIKSLGATFDRFQKKVLVHGRGRLGLLPPNQPLNCGNSGTTLRLLFGILSGHPFSVTLIGDTSLSRRPMKRVSDPLRQMGAKINLVKNEFIPAQVQGIFPLQPLDYSLPIASAQLKSSLLLAGLFAEGKTTLRGKIQSRDHTEKMLPSFGVNLEISDHFISIQGLQKLQAAKIKIPGDISSAAFWIAAGILIPQSKIEIQDVSLNPSRIGILNILKRMGAKINIELTHIEPEPMGNLYVTSSPLQGTSIEAHEIPSLIDEIPLIAILAPFAEGVTRVQGAEELRVKESDRIEAIAKNLKAMNVQIETSPDGFSIQGPQKVKGARIQSFQDHRIAMAFSIAALRAEGVSEIEDANCVEISYPSFYETLRKLQK